MKLKFLRVYQQNNFHCIKIALALAHFREFGIYISLSKALSAPAFPSGDPINQRASLVTSIWMEGLVAWAGAELSLYISTSSISISNLYIFIYISISISKHWLYQFSALLLVSRVTLTKSTQSFGFSVLYLDSTN